jgi:hypothetical protein
MRRPWTAAWQTPWQRLAIGIVGFLVVLVLIVVLLPPLFVKEDTLAGLKAQNEVRTTLLQGLAGTVLLVGVYFTWRQLHTAREGQITERYTRAIDQLGKAELDVRLGGIYALERIARDSPDDGPTIREVLSAFVRGHSPWPPRLPGQYVATAPWRQLRELQERAPDVQASVTVLGRGGLAEARGSPLDLNGVDLRGASLRYLYLEGVHLIYAHLSSASLIGAHLEGANLFGAHLEGANLNLAHLEGAILYEAHLEGATLYRAHLEGATLAHADLSDVMLQDARCDDRTSWPAGFDWHAAGVISDEDGADGRSEPGGPHWPQHLASNRRQRPASRHGAGARRPPTGT